jgi:ribosomal protein S18 acetylase RimI-like enzyme
MARTDLKKLNIRPLREADIESIIAIDARITGEEKSGFWRGMLMVYDPAARMQSSEQEGGQADVKEATHPTYLCDVAESSGVVVGFILGDVQAWQFGIPRCGRIIAIGVHPDHRRSGVATKLARGLLETFKKMNLPVTQCLVRTGDPLGEFFRSLGFAPSPWETLERGVS